MKITSITITETMNNRRQLADVSIVLDYGLMLANIKLIDNGAKLFVDLLTFQSPKGESQAFLHLMLSR